MSATYVNVTATATHIRAALRRAFPKTKFSVHSKKYAGGASIDIGWTDGPTRESVDAVVAPFAGAEFDGMQDLKTHRAGWFQVCQDNLLRPCGEHDVGATLFQFGADYVFCNRTLSDAFMGSLKDAWAAMDEAERSKLMNKTRAWMAASHIPSWRLDANLSDFGSAARDVFRLMANQVGV